MKCKFCGKTINAAPENELIRNTMKKADLLLNSYKNPVCSVSGGSDSDVMLDLLERVRGNRKVTYVFFDTGIEYRATLRHLNDLEAKYGIEIVRRKAKKPVPVGCREFGVPFLSKRDSMYIDRLQRKGFQFEDEKFDELTEKYPNCISALKYWCDWYEGASKFSIKVHAGLKEFMLSTPPRLLYIRQMLPRCKEKHGFGIPAGARLQTCYCRRTAGRGRSACNCAYKLF